MFVVKFLLVRGLSIVFGALLYIASALFLPAQVRVLQKSTRWVADAIESGLPDSWAVWVQPMNLDTSLTFAIFVVLAYMAIEIVERVLGLGAAKIRRQQK